jgi:NitT/TauT family transport system permease protein
MSAVPVQYADSARILGASKSQIAHSIYFPAMIPGLVGGVRSTAALTLGIVILAEYLGSPVGLGRVIKYAISYSNAFLLFTAIFWAVTVGILVDRILLSTFRESKSK